MEEGFKDAVKGIIAKYGLEILKDARGFKSILVDEFIPGNDQDMDLKKEAFVQRLYKQYS